MQATVDETAAADADGDVASEARSAVVAKPFPLGRGIFSRRKVVLAIYALLLLAVLAALAEAKAVVLPLATAFLLSFLFRPVVRRAEALRVPAPLVAALLVLILGVGLGFSVYALKDPATDWLREAPYSLKQLEYRIEELRKPIADMKAASDALDDLRGGDAQADKEVVVKEQALDEIVVIETSSALMSVFTTLVVLFFILGWGQRLFRNLVSVIPQFGDRREAVNLVRDIERSITRYLTTITLINVVLGLVVAAAMYLLGMPNALLWGVVAGLLNYVPYLGPAVTALILAFASALTFPSLSEAMLIPGVFLLITAIEGNFITPYAVGSQLTLNPLLIFLSLILWFWMWGFIGALLTVPILVCIKAVLAHAEGHTAELARLFD
ncbi:MAG: AI-2E family transporter [Gammaproteobacteria bacterium]|nr:AI-2E family transporter [Gammaproteobacteria bacterium]